MMYGFNGGCTTLIHLGVRFPILLLVAGGLAGFSTYVTGNPGTGDRLGTSNGLTKIQDTLIKEHPELTKKVSDLQANFNKLADPKPSEEQVKYVLHITDACTDVKVSDVQKNPDERRDAAWLFYLDTYAREGPQKAKLLFKNYTPPQRK